MIQNKKGKPQLPVDHGWAWFVMIGAFVNICLFLGFIRALSLLFIQFLEKYQRSALMTTLAFGLSSGAFAIGSILGPSYLLHKFQVRTLAVTGAFINFFSILGIGFAPHIIVFNALFITLGFSHGLIMVPQTVLVGQYFNKRRSFAIAFVNLGLSVATMGGPPLTQFLLNTYGLQGTVLLIAGMNMNCIPASMLLWPTSHYAETEVLNHTNDETDGLKTEISCAEEEPKEKVYKKDDIITGDELNALTNSNSKNDGKTVPLRIVSPRFRSVSESHGGHLTSGGLGNESSAYTVSDRNIATSKNVSNDNHSLVSGLIDRISLSSSIQYLGSPSPFSSNAFLKQTVNNSKQGQENTIEFQIEIDRLGKSAHSFQINPDNYESKNSQKSLSEESHSKPIGCLNKMTRSMSNSIYTNPLGILLLLASGLGIHTQACVAYMPAAGKENGLTDDQISILVTIVGISDLFCKIGLGLFADLGLVKRIHIAFGCQLFCGILLQFVGYFKGFGLMILLQVLMGLSIGALHVLLPVISVDLLGLKHMGHIMSGYFLINGIITFIDHLVVGTLKDVTDSFIGSYHYFGSLLILSALILLSKPLVARLPGAKKV